MKALEYIKRLAKWCFKHYGVTAFFLMVVINFFHLQKEYMGVYTILYVVFCVSFISFFWNLCKQDTFYRDHINNQRKIADELEKLNRNLQK